MSNYTKSLTAKIVLVFFFFGYCFSPATVMAKKKPLKKYSFFNNEGKQQKNAKILFESGKSSYESGDYARAVKKLKKALQNDPSLYEAHKIIGMAYKKENVMPEAYNEFVKYLASAPDDNEAVLMAGVVGAKIGKSDRARVYLETGLAKKPGNIEAKMALANLNYMEGYPEPARDALNEIIETKPGNGEAHLLLGKVYFDQGEKDLGKEHLKRASELMPTNAEPDVFLADLAYNRGEFEEARVHLEKIAGRKNAGPEVNYRLAICYLAENHETAALDQFEKTIEKNPAYEQAGYQAGMLHKERGNNKKAIEHFKNYAGLNPEHFDSQYELAILYMQEGEQKKGNERLEKAISLDPENGRALYLLGKMEYERGEFEKAYPHLRKALALDPANTEIRYLLSSNYMNLPDFDAAERELEWIIERDDSQEAKEKLLELRQKREELGKNIEHNISVSDVKTIGVIPFKNAGTSGYDWVSGALVEMIAADMITITSVQVVDTAALDKFMKEQDLITGSASPAYKRLGAQALMTGSYTVHAGEIKINAHITDTETFQVIAAGERTGDLDDIFSLERSLISELVDQYVPLTNAERGAISGGQTLGLRSLENLSEGKKLYYMGKGEEAEKYLSKVVSNNPDYKPAISDLRSVQDAVSNAETLAIMPFKNSSGNTDYDWMGMGISESLTTDMKKITGIYLVERAEIDVALEELKLGMLGMLDEKTAPKVGEMVGAGVILVGSYQVVNKKLRIDARMVDVETGAILLTQKVQGYEDDIFELEEQLALRISDVLNVSVTAEEMARLKDKPNIEKFKSYIISQSSFSVGDAASAGTDDEVINTVAVAKFKNYSGEKKFAYLEEAIPGYLVTELKARAGMNLIEREQLDQVMTEMAISQTSYLDENSASQVGALVGADAILIGFYQIQKSSIRVDARVIKTNTGEVLKTVSVEGNTNNIFDVEEDLTVEIMAALGIEGGPGAGLAKESGGIKRGNNSALRAASYSFFLPGSSQYYLSDKKTKATIMFAADVALLLGATFLSMQTADSFNDYASSDDSASYNDAVDSMATRNMLVYSVLGLGTYSAIDAYMTAKKAQTNGPANQDQPVVAGNAPAKQ